MSELFTGNPILDTDSYKLSHPWQLPVGTEKMYGYLEPRNEDNFKEIPIVGLNYYIKKYGMTPFTQADINQAEDFAQMHGVPFYKKGYELCLNEYGGFDPISIKAVPEGTVVSPRNAVLTVESVGSEMPWMALNRETRILRAVWGASTVAAISREVKKIYRSFLEETSDLEGEAKAMKEYFCLNDFGSRGVSSTESSALMGFGHLTSSRGTDNILSCCLAMDYYDSDMPGFSIPASEHSTVTCWQRGMVGEKNALANHIHNFGSAKKNPSGLYAFVSDSTDLFTFINQIICGDLKQDILAADNTLVVRPDSGEPTDIVPRVLQALAKGFGGTTNSKGKLVLHPKVRVIQGDGVTLESIPKILQAVSDAGFSTENLVFGMGGGLLQHIDRDTCGWAMKCSSVRIDDTEYPVVKRPKTDLWKSSKRGKMRLACVDDVYTTVLKEESPELYEKTDCILQTVYRPGEHLINPSLYHIRQRCSI